MQTRGQLPWETKKKAILSLIILRDRSAASWARCLSRTALTFQNPPQRWTNHMNCVCDSRDLRALASLLSVSSVQATGAYSRTDLGHNWCLSWLSNLSLKWIILVHIWPSSPKARSSLGPPGKSVPGFQNFQFGASQFSPWQAPPWGGQSPKNWSQVTTSTQFRMGISWQGFSQFRVKLPWLTPIGVRPQNTSAFCYCANQQVLRLFSPKLLNS